MGTKDAVFTGSIPALYDRYLGGLLFQPYAEEVARRLSDLATGSVLETAAGTGIVTQALARTLPVPVHALFSPVAAGQETAVLEIDICLAAGLPAGEYPLEWAWGELVDDESGRAIKPELTAGTLTILSAVTEYAPECQPHIDIDPEDLHATFRLEGGTARPGEVAALPFIVRANARSPALTFSADFDEEVLEAVAIEPVYAKGDGSDYDVQIFEFNNQNATAGNGGTEGFLAGGIVIGLRTRIYDLPANRDVHVLTFKMLVKPGTGATATEVMFQDGSPSAHMPEPWTNALAAGDGVDLADLETAGSFVLIGGFLSIAPESTDFIRGDSNGDATVNISDALHTLGFLFQGGDRPPCWDAADSNDDGTIDMSDPIGTFTYLFLGGIAIPMPFPRSGEDPTADGLGCEYRRAS